MKFNFQIDNLYGVVGFQQTHFTFVFFFTKNKVLIFAFIIWSPFRLNNIQLMNYLVKMFIL